MCELILAANPNYHSCFTLASSASLSLSLSAAANHRTRRRERERTQVGKLLKKNERREDGDSGFYRARRCGTWPLFFSLRRQSETMLLFIVVALFFVPLLRSPFSVSPVAMHHCHCKASFFLSLLSLSPFERAQIPGVRGFCSFFHSSLSFNYCLSSDGKSLSLSLFRITPSCREREKAKKARVSLIAAPTAVNRMIIMFNNAG